LWGDGFVVIRLYHIGGLYIFFVVDVFMAKKIYYGVMTTAINNCPYGEFWYAEMIYSAPWPSGKPANVEISEYRVTTLKEWYDSKSLAEKALELRKKSLLELEHAGEIIGNTIFKEFWGAA
jgi:hypothetical protein